MKPRELTGAILVLALTPAAGIGLRAVASEFGVSPLELLNRFLADLTDTAGNGGSDERELAQAWADRSLTFGHPPRTGRAKRRLWRIQDEAYRIRMEERRAFAASLTTGSRTDCGS